jgi:hypothetical protein
MMTLESVLSGNVLPIADSILEAALKVDDPQSLLLPKMDKALERLDRLLGAPYGVALQDIEEGNFEKALDELKRVVVQQPLHLPARLLQIQLLRQQHRFDIALHRINDLLEAFSYREDLVPVPIYQAFLDKTLSTPIRPGASAPLQFRFTSDGYCMRAVWCSPTVVAIEWFEHREGWFNDWDDLAISFYSWDGTEILRTPPNKHHSLEMLTLRYAGYRNEDEKLVVIDLRTGKELPESPLDEETFRAIFLPSDRALASTKLYSLAHFGPAELDAGKAVFCDVVLRLGTYSEWRDESDFIDVGDFLMPYETSRLHEGGTVECSPRPIETSKRYAPKNVPETVEAGWQGMD